MKSEGRRAFLTPYKPSLFTHNSLIMNKQQFILETLLPYFKDPSQCAMVGGKCLYLTSEGKRCAVGKHLLSEYMAAQTGVTLLMYEYGDKIFTPEAREMGLKANEWSEMQQCHDDLANRFTPQTLFLNIRQLEGAAGVELPELKDALEGLIEAGYFISEPVSD